MFYSETLLRKGGRFHLCWVADSWPARLDSTTQRQLSSQDIPKTCDDLMKVITTESSQPSQRFSLRLSSQLMLGLVRVYQKKVDSVIADLHMLNATTMKNSNRRFNIDYAAEEVERWMVPMLELPAPVRESIPEPEETFEEMQSGSVVPNIESITLKEVAIPDFQLPPNDGFGEVDPEQAWQLLRDLTLEQMLGASGPHTLTHSALSASAPAQDPEQAWQLLRDFTLEQMLGASGPHTLTHSVLYASAPAQDPVQAWQLLRDLTLEQMLGASGPHTLTHSAIGASAPAPAQDPEQAWQLFRDFTPEQMLGASGPHTLTHSALGASASAPAQDPEQAWQLLRDLVLEQMLGASGPHTLTHSALDASAPAQDHGQAWQLLRDFTPEQMLGASGPHTLTHSALGASAPAPAQDPEQAWQLLRDFTPEQMLGASGPHTLTHSVLDASAPAQDPEQAWQLLRDLVLEQMLGASGPHTLTHSALDASASAPAPAQAAELVPGLELHNTNTMEGMAKCDVTSFRKSTAQDLLREESDKEIPIPEIPPPDLPIPNENEKPLPVPEEPGPAPEEPAEVPAAAEALPQEPEILTLEVEVAEPPRKSRQCGGASSESAPGGRDTAASLGDSDHTTDSEGFIRVQWGTEGTMVKIMKMVKAEIRPLNMDSLMSFGPMVPGCKRIIAARCFTSIMNLKEHGFIKIRKDPDTSEILDIFLGPIFDTC